MDPISPAHWSHEAHFLPPNDVMDATIQHGHRKTGSTPPMELVNTSWLLQLQHGMANVRFRVYRYSKGSLRTGSLMYTHPQGVQLPTRDPGPSPHFQLSSLFLDLLLSIVIPVTHTPTQNIHWLTRFRKVTFERPATSLHRRTYAHSIRKGCVTDRKIWAPAGYTSVSFHECVPTMDEEGNTVLGAAAPSADSGL